MRTRALAALSAAALALPLAATTALPASADDPAPIALEPLTPRSTFQDDVSIKFKVKHERSGTSVVRLSDPSRITVVRITVQPGARFPLHTHPGPVIVTVAEGELTYVDAETCEEHVYPAGTAFVDTGTHVHTAYGSTSQVTTLIATFLAAPATGPLTLPEAVQTSPCT